MNPHTITRLFPHASRSFIEANAPQKMRNRPWTEDDVSALRLAYSDSRGVCLAALAVAFGRSEVAISLKANELGITSKRGTFLRREATKKKLSEVQKAIASMPGARERLSQQTKDAHKKNGHPRGFLGKKRTPEELAKMKAGSRAAWENKKHRVNTPEFRQAISERSARAAALRSGENCYSRAKSGWRTVGDQRFFARSKWEANYARYLESQRERGVIVEWKHEPEVFWFEKIKRGVRSYKPDFRVISKDGTIAYHEVKGWMDPKSKTKLKRMKKYHPAVVVHIFGEQWFRQNQKALSKSIPGWE